MKISKTTLPNGLRVLFVPMKDNPTVTVLTLVAAGSRRELSGEHGLAHFLEHMCFKGTENRPKPLDIAKELEGLGASSNAFTGQGYTGYYAKAQARHSHALMDIISDLYLNPTLPDGEIEKEKGVIVEEINMYEDMPRRMVEEIYTEHLYGDTPAGRTIIGTKASVRSFTRDDLVRFRDRNYRAGNTVVVVAGTFDKAAMLRDIKKRFGKVPEGTLKSEPRYKVAAPTPVKLRTKATEQVNVVIGVPAFGRDHKDEPAGEMLAAVLGAGMSSRLFQKIREEMGLCYFVYASLNAHRTYGDLSFHAGVPIGKEADAVREMVRVAHDVAKNGVTQDELDRAKNYAIGNMMLELEASDEVAFYAGIQEAAGLPLRSPQQRAKELRAVTEKDIQRVARALFKPGAFKAALISPHKDAKPIADALKG